MINKCSKKNNSMMFLFKAYFFFFFRRCKTMKNNIFVFLFLAAILKTATNVTISCGQNMCLCDDQKLSARCRPDRKNGKLFYFPDLPRYIKDVTFKCYRRQNISVSDLLPLSRLPLTTLTLQEMHIQFLQMGLFQSFRNLKRLQISHSPTLISEILRDSLINITPIFEELTLNSNKLNFKVKDVFKYLEHTNIKMLILASNPLLDFDAGVVRKLHLKTLDLSSSKIKNMIKLCPANSVSLLPSLSTLQLGNTKIKTIPNNFFSCFPNLKTISLEKTKLGTFPTGFCSHSQNVTSNLKKINLGETGVRGVISNKHFKCLTNLKTLDLDRNRITEVPLFCNSLGNSFVPKLLVLSLQKTSITFFQHDSMNCLPALQTLDLKNNRLKTLPTFCGKNNTSYTPNLKVLSLKNTGITTLFGYKFNCLPNLQHLDLQGNYFSEVPLFCNDLNQSINPVLKYLDLSHTKIKKIKYSSFLCLASLETLDLSYTEIFQLDDNIFSFLRSLECVQISYLTNLKSISKYAFNCSSLRTLKFQNNNFDFEKKGKYSPVHLFKSCANITTLDLSGNHFSTGSLSQEILKPLTKLVNLSLAENRMDTIHVDTFRYSKTLKKISLKQNRLIGWNENVFQNLSNLVDLDLSHNKISVFNETSVPANILNSLKTLSLAYNPFNCGCDLLWFKTWSKKQM